MGLQDSSRLADLTNALASARTRLEQQGAQLRSTLGSEFAQRLEGAFERGLKRLTRAGMVPRLAAGRAATNGSGAASTGIAGLGSLSAPRVGNASVHQVASEAVNNAPTTRSGNEPRSLLEAIIAAQQAAAQAAGSAQPAPAADAPPTPDGDTTAAATASSVPVSGSPAGSSIASSATANGTVTSPPASNGTTTPPPSSEPRSLLEAIIAAQQAAANAAPGSANAPAGEGTAPTMTGARPIVGQTPSTDPTALTTSTAASGGTTDLVRIANEFAERVIDIFRRAAASGRPVLVPSHDPTVDQYGLTATDRADIIRYGGGSVEQWVQEQISRVRSTIQAQGLDGSDLNTRQLLALAEISTHLDATGRSRGISQQSIDEVRALGPLNGVRVYSTQGNLDLRAQVAAAQNAGVYRAA